MRIRRANRSDAENILMMIKELAEYEQAPDQVEATTKHLDETLFSERPNVFCDLVEVDGNVVGMAIWFLNYSTWQGRHGIYVEDLYVREVARGKGFGTALLSHLASICLQEGYGRLQWWVLDWNEPAIEFYRNIGAQAMDEWTVFRVSDEALKSLAERQA